MSNGADNFYQSDKVTVQKGASPDNPHASSAGTRAHFGTVVSNLIAASYSGASPSLRRNGNRRGPSEHPGGRHRIRQLDAQNAPS
jgi:hypothetical protein